MIRKTTALKLAAAIVVAFMLCLLIERSVPVPSSLELVRKAYAEDSAHSTSKSRKSRKSRRKSKHSKPKVEEHELPKAIGAGTAGHEEFNADLERPEGIDAVLVLDSSRSMTRTDPKRLRDQGARLFLRFLTKEDRLAVIRFDREDEVVADLADVNTRNLRSIDQAIGDIKAEGNFTNLQKPLETALELLRKKGRKKATKAVILLSDGKLDPHPEDGTHEEVSDQLFGVDLPGYQRDNIRIYTLALSSAADKELLNKLAKETGALHWYTPDADTIHKKFSDLFLALKKPQVMEMKGGGFTIDESVREATFYITREKRGGAEIRLLDPKGAVITSTTLPIGVKWFKGDDFDVVTVDAPEPGNWKVEGIDKPEGFATLLTDLKLQVRWPEKTALAVGDRIMVAARLTEKGEVFEAPDLTNVLSYVYKVEEAEGGETKLSGVLNDKGKDGDETKGDNIYSATIHVDFEGDLRAIVGVAGPTFTRQQQLLFSAKGAQVELVLEEADEFAKRPERFKITIANELVRLRDLKVQLIAQTEDAEHPLAIETERDRTSRTEYYVDPQLLEVGEYELFAQVTGTNKGEKEEFASSRLEYTGTGKKEPEVVEEPVVAYIIVLTLTVLWSAGLGYLFLVKKPVGKEAQVAKLKAYEHPEELLARLEQVKETASETKRKAGDSDKMLTDVEALASGKVPEMGASSGAEANSTDVEDSDAEAADGSASEEPAEEPVEDS
ncbi:MAG: VWA domain-containing protein, partial [Bdellovibrionales bacterium]|nr:VWA domain-containing protein [Bdellovibrionales bacterium]